MGNCPERPCSIGRDSRQPGYQWEARLRAAGPCDFLLLQSSNESLALAFGVWRAGSRDGSDLGEAAVVMNKAGREGGCATY